MDKFSIEMMIKETVYALERFGIKWDSARDYLRTRFQNNMDIVDKYKYAYNG